MEIMVQGVEGCCQRCGGINLRLQNYVTSSIRRIANTHFAQLLDHAFSSARILIHHVTRELGSTSQPIGNVLSCPTQPLGILLRAYFVLSLVATFLDT